MLQLLLLFKMHPLMSNLQTLIGNSTDLRVIVQLIVVLGIFSLPTEGN